MTMKKTLNKYEKATLGIIENLIELGHHKVEEKKEFYYECEDSWTEKAISEHEIHFFTTEEKTVEIEEFYGNVEVEITRNYRTDEYKIEVISMSFTVNDITIENISELIKLEDTVIEPIYENAETVS